MLISSKRYDTIWWVAVAISTISVFVADSQYRAIHFLLPVLLSVSIGIAAFLVLFTKRMESEQDCAIDLTLRDDEFCESISPSLQMQTQEMPDLENAEVVIPARPNELRLDWIMHKQLDESVAQQQTIRLYLKQISGEQQIARRRNLLNEACEMAKTLQGTNLNVEVSPDNWIVIKPGRQERNFGGLEKAFGVEQSETQLVH